MAGPGSGGGYYVSSYGIDAFIHMYPHDTRRVERREVSRHRAIELFTRICEFITLVSQRSLVYQAHPGWAEWRPGGASGWAPPWSLLLRYVSATVLRATPTLA